MTLITPPSPSGPGRPKSVAKREAILEAARRLFLGNGYEGSSMEAIAAEAGVSKLTLYSHFKDKEDLFCAAVQATCERRVPRQLFLLPADEPIDAVLRRVGLAFWQLITSPESIGLHRVMISLGATNPRLSRLFFEAGPQQVLGEVSRLLETATRQGQLRVDDSHLAAEHFCSLVKGVHHFYLLIGYAPALDDTAAARHVAHVVELFVRAHAPA